MRNASVEFSAVHLGAPEAGVRIPISIVIPVLNEAPRLDRLLPTLSWADDVIVVDGGSTDETISIARKGAARVFTVRNRTIGTQRNAGIMAARHRWILALDADEMVSRELREDLASLSCRGSDGVTAYRVRSRNWYLGRELRFGPWGRDWKVRVFTSTHRFSAARVHENLVELDEIGTLHGTLLHWSYRDVPHHVGKVVTYARWAADDLRESGRRPKVLDMLVRPWWRFVRDYVVLGGWRDGAPGFVASIVSSFYVFMKYATLLTTTSGPDLS